MRDIKRVLIDLEGVVHQRGAAIPGSIEAISRLGHLNLDFRFVTNTTRLPLRLIVDELKNVGIIAEPLHVFTRSTTFGSRTPEDAICSTGLETDWDGWAMSPAVSGGYGLRPAVQERRPIMSTLCSINIAPKC